MIALAYDDITEQANFTTEPRFEKRPFVARPSRDLLFIKLRECQKWEKPVKNIKMAKFETF